MRLVWLALIGIAALSLLVACGDGGKSGSGKTPVASAAPTPTPFVGRDPSVSFSDVCQKSGEKQFANPEKVIDTSKTYVATVKTAKGDIVLQLDQDKAPVTANSFAFLACKGYYDGVTFHRVLPGFVAQGGDPTGSGSGGPGYTVPAEFEGSKFETGVVGLARTSDPNSGGSQFYIMLGRGESLDGQYTAFAHVTSGMDVANALTPRDPSANPNAPPGDTIDSITIEEK